MKGKRIAFLVHNIHLGGGGERVAISLSDAFAKKGFEVTIVSAVCENDTPIPFGLSPMVNLVYLFKNKQEGPIAKLIAVLKLNRLLPKQTFDFVIGVGSNPSLLLSLSRTQAVKIGSFHGSFNAMPRVWRYAVRLFLSRLDIIVSLTEHDKKILKKWHHHVHVIPNSSTFLGEPQAELNQKTILALGRLSEEKDFKTMIQLFERFCETDATWKLRIRGKGPLEEELRKQIEESKWHNQIELLPPTNDVKSEYQQASIVLLTSKNEGLPMVLIEAQSFGIPVISFDCETGPGEIIVDGVTGYLIDPNKKEEMVTRLVELTADIEKRKEMGRQAKIHSERFSEEKIMKQWLQLFQN